MCLNFSHYLAAHHVKVLYCVHLESYEFTQKEKIIDLGTKTQICKYPTPIL